MQSAIGLLFSKKISYLLAPVLLCGSANVLWGSNFTVTPGNLNGWSVFALNYDPNTGLPLPTTATTSFVTGPTGSPPSGPPLGIGSFQVNTGTDGNSYAGVHTDAYDGTPLSSLTAISYSTFVQQNFDVQAMYLVLELSNNDQLFLEPVYQNGGYQYVDSGGTVQNGPGGYPDQCPGHEATCEVNGTWQSWNAMTGGYWSNQGYAKAGSGGPPVITIANYLDAFPTANITITGIDLQAGAGGTAWANFIGNIDAFHISTSGGVNDTYDFEPGSPTTTPEPATFALMGSGLFLAGAFAKRLKRKA